MTPLTRRRIVSATLTAALFVASFGVVNVPSAYAASEKAEPTVFTVDDSVFGRMRDKVRNQDPSRFPAEKASQLRDRTLPAPNISTTGGPVDGATTVAGDTESTEETESAEQKTTDTTVSFGLRDSYDSLAEALVSQISEAEGLDTSAAAKAPNLDKLASKMRVDTSGFDSFSDYARKFISSDGIDAKVAAAGASYAAQLDALRKPQLTLDSTVVAPKISDESLLYGLVLDKSFAALAQGEGLIDRLQREGIGSSQMLKDWEKAVEKGASIVNANLSDSLLSPCHASFLSAMAGGRDAVAKGGFGPECGSCVTAGLFSRHEMNRLFDPSWDTQFYDPTDSVPTVSEFYELHPAVKDLIKIALPSEAERLSETRPKSPAKNHAAGCAAATGIAKDALSGSMPSIISDLYNKAGAGDNYKGKATNSSGSDILKKLFEKAGR